jgi:hypothetical protein
MYSTPALINEKIPIVITVITVYIFCLKICRISCVSSISNLNTLSSPLVIAAQHRPAGAIGLEQDQLQLGAQHTESRLLGINRGE